MSNIKQNKILMMTISELLSDKKILNSFKYKRLYEKTNKKLKDYQGSRLKYKRLYEKTNKELKDYQGSRLKYKRLYEKTNKKLKDYEGSRLKYKRLYEKTNKELKDYKGSRLKYKRLASFYENKYNQIINSKSYKLATFFKKIFKTFFFFKRKEKKEKVINKIELTSCILRDTIYRLFKDFNSIEKPVTLIYADLNLNVVDGSSIWLSSVINLFSKDSTVIVVSKYNIETNLIISNIKGINSVVFVEPKDIGLENGLTLSNVERVLVYIDEIIPNIQNLIVRGIEAISEVIKTNNFKYRLIPYLTNFYIQHSNGKREIKEEANKIIKLTNLQVKVWLWQTIDMKDFIEKSLDIILEKYILFPPIIEDTTSILNKNLKINNEGILIGYAGKIQPDWGVLELIEEVEKLRKKGLDVKLRIVSSKVSWRGTIKTGKGFVEKVNKYLKKDFIEFIQNVNREEAIRQMGTVNFIWSWRAEAFETTTLELSTKLLEAVAIGKPVLNYPSDIHKKVLGEEYPYFLKDLKNLEEKILLKSNDLLLLKKKEDILKKYSYSTRLNIINSLFNRTENRVILFNGHDFKFIDHFYSFMKEKGYLVYKDYWEWGTAANIERSKHFFKKSDTIFCEWGLANAVWYSQQNILNKELFIRTHLQEINPKAKKFGPQILMKNTSKNIFVSERVRNVALDMWKWKKEKTLLIPNYVLTDDFKPQKNRDKYSYTFGMVGITPQRKRLDRAIDLIEQVLKSYPESKLYIKGKRPEEYEWMHAPGRVTELDYYYEQYNRINNNEKLKNAIIFDGFDNDMPEWYQKIDFILSPSDFESFHYALADGVSSGCLPIVWNWEESKLIYDKNWVVKNIDEAILKINYYLNLNSLEKKREIERNRELIILKYGYQNIFEKLAKLITREGT